MISAASTQIEAKAAEMRQVFVNGVYVNDYATVQAALAGAVAGYIVIMICFGKERRGCDLATVAAGSDDVKPVAPGPDDVKSEALDEKITTSQQEKV